MKKLGIMLAAILWTSSAVAQDQTTTYNKEQMKQDYKAFLQQLKQLNAQYKEVTGEISKVMKEEGVPQWEMGESDQKIGELLPKQDTILVPEPGVTIKDGEKEMVVTLDMPGIKRDTLKIAVQDGTRLVVSASRKTENEAKKLEKSLDLPSAVDPKAAKATYEDGVLTIKLAKISSKEVLIPVR